MKSLLPLTALLAFASPTFADLPKTTAESTEFKATTRYADVMTFCERLAKESPVARLDSFGVSAEGRKLPLLVLSESGSSGKLKVLLIGNIHAGEVDGKEALLAFAREIATGKDRALLKDLDIFVVPILNADGNERLAKGKRPEQGGPDEVGDRENAGGFDLNRDFVKLETPEVRALVKLIRKENPAVILDSHTTNGSHHRHTMTYDGARHPDAGANRIDFIHNKLLPAAGERMKAATGFTPFVYGNFNADRSRWETYPAQPRYGVQYFGLRGRIGLLTESYSYASFPDRVKASLEFIRGVCQEAAARKDEIRKVLADSSSPGRVAVRNKTVAQADKKTVLGFVEEERNGRRTATATPKEYQVQVVSKLEPTLEISRPFAYLVPAGFAQAIETLQRHGFDMQEMREDIELPIEVYQVQKLDKAPRKFQGHLMNRLEATMKAERRRVPAGTTIVRTNGPLGSLASLLLEPQSEDGLATWNFFDAGLKEGGEFPVLRLTADIPVVTGSLRPLAEDRQLNKPIDYSLIYGRGAMPNFSGNPVGQLTWLDDGEHYLQQKRGTLYAVHARTGKLEPFFDPKKIEASLKALPGLEEGTAQSLSRRGQFAMNPNRTAARIEFQGDYILAFFDGKPAIQLTKSAAGKELPTFSPDGQHLAFARAGNLFVVDVATQKELPLTTDGGGFILNGRADWVYEEEIFNRNAHPFWWSPDSKRIAFMRFDDSPVAGFTVVNHIPTRLNVEKVMYPKAGDPNPLIKLGIAAIDGSTPVFADFTGYDPKDFLIARAGWTPDSKAAYCYAQNRVQSWLDVCLVGIDGASPVRKLFRDTTKAWIDDTGPLQFLPDGTFIYCSDRSGYRHAYRFAADGKMLNPVTSGDWEVKAIHRVDEAGGWVYFAGTKDCPHGTCELRASVDGSKIERLTPEPGTHNCNVSPKANLFVDSFSSLQGPTRVLLRSADGQVVRTLDTNPVYSREEYEFGKTEAVEIPVSDNFTLWGTVTYPPNFDRNKKHPVWVKTYAGPHMPSISDSWGRGALDDQAMARAGIIVFHIDPRSASGVSRQSAWAAYKRLGVQELKDLEAAVDWLAKNEYVDAKRVGISGHSYGGYITAFALTHSKKFCAGVSGAPVTDWRNYDSIYTERYMLTPKENPAGYDASSVVKAARNLHGRLLLIHGLMDDNVHVQNSVQLVNELQRFDKDFEVMVYPMARHGIFGRHYQRQITNFICKSLGVDVHIPASDDAGDRPTNPRGPGRRRTTAGAGQE